MGKSFNRRDFYDEGFDMEYEDGYSYKGHKKKSNRKNDKKLEIQQARKKAQAERDRAIRQYTGNPEN